MPTDRPLWHKIHYDQLYHEMVKIIGYTGFSLRDLAVKMKAFAEKYSAPQLAAVLKEIALCTGNRVGLTPDARRHCWQFPGPPPEKWDSFYRHPDGSPMKRPKGREKPPDIPDREDEQIMDAVRSLLPEDLFDKLAETRNQRQTKQTHDIIQCLESEFLLRGEQLPPADVRPAAKERQAKPRQRRRKKS